MDTMLPAYKAVGDHRYRETSGLYWEDFEPGDVFEHRPGRTVLDVDTAIHCVDAGASFVTCTGLDPDLVDFARQSDVPFQPTSPV